MEDKAFVDSPIVHNTQDCFTPMDQQNSLNKGSGEEQLEVCYPYDHNPNTATIDKDAMDSYIDNHLSVSYNSKVERTSSMSRKLSLYSENIIVRLLKRIVRGCLSSNFYNRTLLHYNKDQIDTHFTQLNWAPS